jgi:hypothetical protein
MKYSLRSLMQLSIRDIALVTVIVAILMAWWVDHRRLMAHAGAVEDAKFLCEFAASGGYHSGLPRFERLCRKYGVSPEWADHGND